MDLSCDFKPHAERANSLQKIGGTETNESLSPELYTSNIATITPSVGGVGYNVALAAHRAGGNLFVRLCSLVADDV